MNPAGNSQAKTPGWGQPIHKICMASADKQDMLLQTASTHWTDILVWPVAALPWPPATQDPAQKSAVDNTHQPQHRLLLRLSAICIHGRQDLDT